MGTIDTQGASGFLVLGMCAGSPPPATLNGSRAERLLSEELQVSPHDRLTQTAIQVDVVIVKGVQYDFASFMRGKASCGIRLIQAKQTNTFTALVMSFIAFHTKSVDPSPQA